MFISKKATSYPTYEQDSTNTPILMITGDTSALNKRVAKHDYVDLIIYKPFHIKAMNCLCVGFISICNLCPITIFFYSEDESGFRRYWKVFKKRTLVYFIFILILSLGISHAAELRFDEALDRMKKNNEALFASRTEEKKAEYLKKSAWGLYLPKVGVEGRYTKINDSIVISETLAFPPPIGTQSLSIDVQDDTFFKTNLNIIWPVYTGGKITAMNQAAEANITESKEKSKSISDALTSELVRRYYGVRLADKVVAVRKQVQDSLNEHLNQAKKLQENGMIALSEELHAEVTWAEADREYKKAKRELKIIQVALNSILSSDVDIKPSSSIFILKQIEAMPKFLEFIETKNPLLKQISAKKLQAHQGTVAEKSEYYPTVYFFGKHELYKDDLTVLEPEWAVGVGFDYNLFNGLSSLNNVKAARQVEAQVGYLEKDAYRKIKTLIEKKYNELMLSLEQYEATETSYNFAVEYVRVMEKAFKAGMTTSINVVDAQLALARVKIEKLNAAYQFDVALAELLEASGSTDQLETYREYENAEEIH